MLRNIVRRILKLQNCERVKFGTKINSDQTQTKETTLERADFTLKLLMFVTAEKERVMFIVFFLSILCELAKKSALSNEVSLTQTNVTLNCHSRRFRDNLLFFLRCSKKLLIIFLIFGKSVGHFPMLKIKCWTNCFGPSYNYVCRVNCRNPFSHEKRI